MYHQITLKSEFCYGHRLQGYDGKCCRLHGHNGRVEVTLAAKLNEQGFVVDFSIAKPVIKTLLDYYDHYMILERSDPMVEVLKLQKEEFRTLAVSPTAENIAATLFDAIVDRILWSDFGRTDILVVSVKLYETENNSVEVIG